MPELATEFKSLPEEYQLVIRLAEETHKIIVAPLQLLVGGWSGALVYLVSVSKNETARVEHCILKLDRKAKRAKSDEATRHNALISKSTPEFARDHIAELAFDRVEHHGAIAIFYRIAGQSLLKYRPLSNYERQSQLRTIFAETNRVLLDEWNVAPSFEVVQPQKILQKWLGFRLDSGGNIESFLQETLRVSPDTAGLLVNGHVFPNPLSYARKTELWGNARPIDIASGFIHGDLNANNILVRFSVNEESLDGYYLIDFALFKEQMPLFYDQRYLEMSYLTHALSRITPAKGIVFLTLLAVADVPDPQKVPIEMSGVSSVIGAARDAFGGWVQDNYPSLHDDLWGQYWLAGVAAGLGYCHKADLSGEQRLAGLIYAAANLKRYAVTFSLPTPTNVELLFEDLRRRIAELEGVAADPVKAAEDTERRIVAGLEGVRQPARPEPERPARARFVNPPPVTAPTYFQDRHAETELLAGFLAELEVRLVTVTGRGGVGKTAMVCRLLKGLESGRLPDDLGEQTVQGIVYLRTPSAHPVSFANLFADLCRLLPVETADRLGQRYKDPRQTPGELLAAALEEFPAGQTVVVLLDNLEDLLDDTGVVADAVLDEGLRALLSAPAHGVKVIMTTRVAPQPLLLYQPGGQRRIDLDEGLASPYAERLLRARDPDGRLGLQTASDEVLGQLRERTRGYPRALEAVAAILSADRDTSLAELLAETERLPENVVEALVGEAFQRLDGLAQQVMQALAIFPGPVPAVAVDYVLQPFQRAINAAPVLTRLVNMQFVRRDAGHYYLHRVDRDYALGWVPAGQPSDREADPVPFTQYTLWDRAADYFTQIQTPRQEWKTLDDLAPQLAEFELRCQGEDYDTAARVLLGIDFDYLITWGHYRYAIRLHTRLQGHLTDPKTTAVSLTNLGTCHYELGDYQQAIDLYQQAVSITRENGNREGEAIDLGRLANCYADLGQTERAIELYEQALAIDREIGYRRGEATQLGDLGNCYADLGQTQRAIELYEQALTIAREIGDRRGEAKAVNNLGLCYAELGDTHRAVELYQQVLVIVRETGYRYGEALSLINLGVAFADLGRWQDAVERLRVAVEIGEAIGNAQAQAEARRDLAWTLLEANDLAAAAETVQTACDYSYPPAQAGITLVDGIIRLRRGDVPAAGQAFTGAIGYADKRLSTSPNDYDTLDAKALALAGLTLTGPSDHIAEATATFDAARAVTTSPGITARVLRRLDTLTPADTKGILQPLQSAASNKG